MRGCAHQLGSMLYTHRAWGRAPVGSEMVNLPLQFSVGNTETLTLSPKEQYSRLNGQCSYIQVASLV